MDIRKTINDKPGLAIGIAAAVGLLGILLLIWEISPSKAESANVGKAFFSDDDGKSWFIDDDSKLSPFDHGGKAACRAAVYRCGNGKPFVAYLSKYSDAQLAQIADAKKALSEPQAKGTRPMSDPAFPMEVKKPGDSKWIRAPGTGAKADAAGYQRVTNVVCPDGSSAVTAVRPSDSNVK